MTTSATDIVATPLTSIPAGEGRTFVLNGQRIAIFHTRAGGVYATQADCPHRKGPLSDGLLGGTTLICPLHAWKFDLSTGKALYGECGLKTYPARVDEQSHVIVTLANPD